MNRSLSTRLEKLEAVTATGRLQVIWAEGLSEAEIQQEIDRRLADGSASKGDVFQAFCWKRAVDPQP